jgi:alkylation response protein AidB-like acyl-CoA dehydrogenase
VAYAKERRQFGAPIGSFQAVKHHLADALLGLEHARPAVLRAAWSVARRRPERSSDVSMAKVLADRAAARSGRAALQVHGAIGYSYEHDLHLWLKRTWALQAAWGDAALHRERVARAVVDAPPA